MITKLEAAEIVTSHGIEMNIILGAKPEGIYDVLDGREIGTAFLPTGDKQ